MRNYGIIFNEKESAKVKEITKIESIQENEIFGQTLVSLVSAGTELALYKGELAGAKYPLYPGYAAIMKVTKIGRKVKNIKINDIVYCMGSHKSFQVMSEDKVIIIPKGLSPEIAVFARIMGISMSTLTTTEARPPAKVIVTGLGVVGHLAALIFDNCGYDVIACDPSETRREIAVKNGIKNVLANIPINDPDILGKVSLVIECSGHEQAVLDGCKVVKKRGEVVCIGVPWIKKTNLYAFDLLYAIFHNYVVLRSGWEWELPVLPTTFMNNSIFENFSGALKWLKEERIKVNNLYEIFSPKEAQKVYQGLKNNTLKKLVAIFDWSK